MGAPTQAVIDPSVVKAIVSDTGATVLDAVFDGHVLVGTLVDLTAADSARTVGGEEALLAFKDNLLREMDGRLTKILGL